MKSTSSTPSEKPVQSDSEEVSADALFTWLSQLKSTEDDAEESQRYASPPCYLAEFSAEDFADHPSGS